MNGVPELETRPTPSRGIYSWKRMDVGQLNRKSTDIFICMYREIEQGIERFPNFKVAS